jgi:hypothetical protein
MKTCDYVRTVMDLYLALPQTPARARRSDRDLAAQFHTQNISLPIIRAALLLATARRLARPAPLPPIRSLFYFLPVIKEVQGDMPAPSYIDYLASKIRLLTT